MTRSPVRRDVGLAVGGLTLVALVLGLVNLGAKSAWLDESFTWSTVDRPFPELLRLLATREGFQILHSLLLWPVNQVSSELAALRLPSALAFAASIPAAWLAGRRLFDERAGLGAALLLAVNAFALQFAQEARSYTMAMMLVTYAGAFLAGEVRSPSRHGRSAWIVASALAVYAHGMALLAVIAQAGSLVLLPPSAGRRRLLRGGVGIIALAVLPVVVLAVLHSGAADDLAWVVPPSWGTLPGLAWLLSGRTVTMVPVYAVGLGVVAVTAFAALRRAPRSEEAWRFVMPVAWFAFPIVSLLALSVVKPTFIDRYMVPGLGGLAVLVGFGLSRFRRSTALAAAFVVAALLASRGVVRWYGLERGAAWSTGDAIANLVDHLETRARPGDAVMVLLDKSWIRFEYEARDSVLRDRLVPVFPTSQWGAFGTGDQSPGGDAFGDREVEQLVADGPDRVWIVATYHFRSEVDPRVNQLLGSYDVRSHEVYGAQDELRLLERRATPPRS